MFDSLTDDYSYHRNVRADNAMMMNHGYKCARAYVHAAADDVVDARADRTKLPTKPTVKSLFNK